MNEELSNKQVRRYVEARCNFTSQGLEGTHHRHKGYTVRLRHMPLPGILLFYWKGVWYELDNPGPGLHILTGFARPRCGTVLLNIEGFAATLKESGLAAVTVKEPAEAKKPAGDPMRLVDPTTGRSMPGMFMPSWESIDPADSAAETQLAYIMEAAMPSRRLQELYNQMGVIVSDESTERGYGRYVAGVDPINEVRNEQQANTVAPGETYQEFTARRQGRRQQVMEQARASQPRYATIAEARRMAHYHAETGEFGGPFGGGARYVFRISNPHLFPEPAPEQALLEEAGTPETAPAEQVPLTRGLSSRPYIEYLARPRNGRPAYGNNPYEGHPF